MIVMEPVSLDPAQLRREIDKHKEWSELWHLRCAPEKPARKPRTPKATLKCTLCLESHPREEMTVQEHPRYQLCQKCAKKKRGRYRRTYDV